MYILKKEWTRRERRKREREREREKRERERRGCGCVRSRLSFNALSTKNYGGEKRFFMIFGSQFFIRGFLFWSKKVKEK